MIGQVPVKIGLDFVSMSHENMCCYFDEMTVSGAVMRYLDPVAWGGNGGGYGVEA